MERDLHVYEKRPTHMWKETKEIEIGDEDGMTLQMQ